MNLSTKLKELRILAESGRAPHIVAYHPENQCFEMVAKEETIIEMCNCIEEMKESLEFTTKCAEHMNGKRESLLKGLNPMFYHTLTYEGDLELYNKTEKAKELLNKYFGE